MPLTHPRVRARLQRQNSQARGRLKNSVFYRIASVLPLLFAAGHTIGFRQNNPEWRADAVLGLMRSIHFDAQGFSRVYWDFFSAFGLFSLFLLFAAVLAWLLGDLPAETLARVRSIAWELAILLCRSHGFELEIRLHHPHRFLNPYYTVFDCGRVALGGWAFQTASLICWPEFN